MKNKVTGRAGRITQILGRVVPTISKLYVPPKKNDMQ